MPGVDKYGTLLHDLQAYISHHSATPSHSFTNYIIINIAV